MERDETAEFRNVDDKHQEPATVCVDSDMLASQNRAQPSSRQ